MTTQVFRGACDASAATRIAGTSCFVTASDEDYVLRVYNAAIPGPPISELDVSAFLQPADPKKEPDIEGSAQIGNRIYWIASHGRDKEAQEQESRQRLFATDVTIVSGRPQLTPIGTPYRTLLADLTAAADLREFALDEAARRAPEDSGGLNIEGMTSTADGHLLIGFRNPIPDQRALLVRIHNPAEVVAGTQVARITRDVLLDLGGRGVRALEPTIDGKYLVLAGSFNDTRNFGLFLWDGHSTAPTQLLDGTALNDLNPEELMLMPQSLGAVQLFSDDGDALVGTKKCKKVEPSLRSFRVATVQLAF